MKYTPIETMRAALKTIAKFAKSFEPHDVERAKAALFVIEQTAEDALAEAEAQAPIDRPSPTRSAEADKELDDYLDEGSR